MAWLRPAAAFLVTAAAGGLVTLAGSAPASAAPCSGTAGVTVVVEYGALGGGTEVSCAPEGGRTADRLLENAGHALTFLQRFPAFVCRIDGVPAEDPCVNTPPADAYWGLWWSDGESGEWSYSSLAAGSLTVPAGGYVAMVWDDSSGDVRPQTGAPAHPTPTPTPDQEALADPRPDPEPVVGRNAHRHSRGAHQRADPATHPEQVAQAVEDALVLRGDGHSGPDHRTVVGRAVGPTDRCCRSARRPGRPLGGR